MPVVFLSFEIESFAQSCVPTPAQQRSSQLFGAALRARRLQVGGRVQPFATPALPSPSITILGMSQPSSKAIREAKPSRNDVVVLGDQINEAVAPLPSRQTGGAGVRALSAGPVRQRLSGQSDPKLSKLRHPPGSW